MPKTVLYTLNSKKQRANYKLIAELVKTIYYDADGSIRIVFSCEDVIARFNSLLEGESNGSDCNVSSPVAV